MLEQAVWWFSIQLKIGAARDQMGGESTTVPVHCLGRERRRIWVACIAHQRLCLNLDIARALDEMRADERPQESRNGAGDGFMDDRHDAFLPSARRLRPSWWLLPRGAQWP